MANDKYQNNPFDMMDGLNMNVDWNAKYFPFQAYVKCTNAWQNFLVSNYGVGTEHAHDAFKSFAAALEGYYISIIGAGFDEHLEALETTNKDGTIKKKPYYLFNKQPIYKSDYLNIMNTTISLGNELTPSIVNKFRTMFMEMTKWCHKEGMFHTVVEPHSPDDAFMND